MFKVCLVLASFVGSGAPLPWVQPSMLAAAPHAAKKARAHKAPKTGERGSARPAKATGHAGTAHTKHPRPGARGKAVPAAREEAGPPAGASKAAPPAPAPEAAPPPGPALAPAVTAPALDLSEAKKNAPGMDLESRQQILGKKNQNGLSIDFGGTIELGAGAVNTTEGGVFDFGREEAPKFDFSAVNTPNEQRVRFERAIRLMSDESFDKASLEFKSFLQDSNFVEFQPESEYQLAKSLYQMEFYESAFKNFLVILEKGAAHPRYRKSIEWLFFMSRKLADQTPVLAQLARYRNVTFPPAYRAEYNYLLAKYLFTQANAFEVQRLADEELARGKQSREAGLDFGKIADAIGSEGGLDFGAKGGAGLDFGGAGLDFGGAGPAAGGAGFDFGAGPAAGAGLDFGAAASGSEAAAPPPVPTTTAEAIKQALELLDQIPATSNFAPRARYLAGLLHYLAGEDQKAVVAFQDTVRKLNPREGGRLDPGVREMAFLSLARIHYGYKQFNRSVYYYDLIDRDSENWLTSLFEASWAYFRRGDFDKALGNLLTLHSPFFEREYFPESQVVKAIIYFEACRYPETRAIVDDFITRYSKLLKEMQALADNKEAPELLHDKVNKLQQQAEENEDEVTARVVNLTLASAEIRVANQVVDQLRRQHDRFEALDEPFRTSPLGIAIGEDMRATLLARSRQAGEVTRQQFEQELYKLKSLLAQALRIKIEVTRAERDLLTKKSVGEASDEEIVAARQHRVVDDEHVYWPYEGEYWRDELGTYEMDFSMCRQAAGH